MQGAGNTNCASLAYTGALQAELKYDPTGRLFEVSGGTLGTQRFAYDGNALIGEYNSVGTLLRRYVHGSNIDADDPLIVYEGAAVSDATRRYLHADPRGSIVAVTNYQGTAIATNSYDEFGIPDSGSGTDIASKGRFRYTGQAWLPELGMYYYKARIYSPTLGRFLQTDPIGYEDQFNLYAYVGNDPINGVDPSGQESACDTSSSCPTLAGKGKDGTAAANLTNQAIRSENTTISSKISGVTVTVKVAEDGAATISASGKVGPVSFSVTMRGTLEPVEGSKAVNVSVDSVTTGGALGEVRSAPSSVLIFQNKSGDLAIKPEGNLVVDVKVPFVKDVTLKDGQTKVVR